MSDTVIVLQEDCILAATGKSGRRPRIKSTRRMELNAHVEVFEQWKEALSSWKEVEYSGGNVKVVLPSVYSSSRIHRIPYATGKQLKQLAEHAVGEEEAEKISDYGITDSNRQSGITLCHASVEESIMRQVLGVFESLGISVGEVTVLMEGYLRALSGLKEHRNKTAIFLLFEDSGVTSVLYQKGVYLYSTRSRIFSERGTLDFETEIVRNISGTLQFYATTSPEMPITDVFYAGCEADDFEVCMEGIHSLNLQASALNVDELCDMQVGSENYLPCIGAMMEDKNRQIDLLGKWQKIHHVQTTKKRDIAKQFIAPGICLGACLIVFAGISAWNLWQNQQIDAVNDWINDAQIQEEYSAANAKKEKSDELGEAYSQVNQMTENLATYSDLDSEIMAKITAAGGSNMSVQIKSMDAQTGLLTFEAKSSDVIDIPTYINKLTQTGLFSDVDYTGYQYDDGGYSLDLSCILEAESAGGEE